MKLSVPANYDFGLIEKLKNYPVSDVYGKLPYDFIGGGRPSFMSTPLSKRRLAEYVSSLRTAGIPFNYLLNSSCMSNREWSGRWHRKLAKFLSNLENMGVSRLTVSTPFLLEIVKKRFPSFSVRVGIFAQIDTPKRARFWESLGADSITLESFSINRDFSRLKAIRDAVKCELQLIVNHPCLPNCPLQNYHQNGFAHSSDGSGQFFLDYCFLRCSRMRIEQPSLFIKSFWIRPEDIGHYEKLGYTSFKLLERGIPSEEILKRLDAYSSRRFTGNLAELILPYGFTQPVKKRRFWLLRNFFRPLSIRPARLKSLYDLIRLQGMMFPLKKQPVRIESSKIPPDFIQGFENRNCVILDCAKCGYCEKIAQGAVSIDPLFQKQSLEQFGNVEEMITSGSLWDV